MGLSRFAELQRRIVTQPQRRCDALGKASRTLNIALINILTLAQVNDAKEIKLNSANAIGICYFSRYSVAKIAVQDRLYCEHYHDLVNSVSKAA